MQNSSFRRFVLSRGGTLLANALLGTKLSDMTSGFEGFHRHIVKELLDHKFRSTAHFFQTELRISCAQRSSPRSLFIIKRRPPRFHAGTIRNSIGVLLYYFLRRMARREP